LFAYISIGIALFFPYGIADVGNWGALPIAIVALLAKLVLAGAALAFLEALLAKMRIFRAPEFLGTAFLLAVLGLLIHFLLGA
jgi:formate hydrogenlyase subunit 4